MSKLKQILYLFLIIFFYLPGLLLAQESWKQAFDDANIFYENKDVQTAFNKGEEALMLAKNEYGIVSSPYAESLRLLTLSSFALGKYGKGIDHAREEMTVRELMDSMDTLEYVKALTNLGILYQITDSLTQAKKYLNQALFLFRKAGPNLSNNYAFATLSLAKLYHAEGERAVAVQLYQQIIDYYRKKNNIKDATYASALYYQALLNSMEDDNSSRLIEESVNVFRQANDMDNGYYTEALYQWAAYQLKQGNYDVADSLFKELNLLFAQNTDSLNTLYASILNNSGLIAQAKGNFAKAENDLKKSYQIRKEILPMNSPELATSANNLASFYKQREHAEEAIKIYAESLEHLPDKGNLPVQFGPAFNNLGSIYWEKGQFVKAEENYRKALAIHDTNKIKSSTDPDLISLHINTIYNLARNFQSLGKYDSALVYFRKSLDICETQYGKNNSTYTAMLSGQAALYQDMGQLHNAQKIYELALRSQEKETGTQSDPYASMLNNVALLYQSMGDFIQAENYFKRSIELKRTFFGPASNQYLAAVANLGLLYIETGDYKLAEPLLEQSLAYHSNNSGALQPELAKDLTNMARLKQATGKYTEAEPLLKRAVEIRKKVFGNDHPDYAEALNNLALFYQTMGNYKEAEPNFVNARNIYKKRYGELHPDYATAIQNLATLYLVMDRPGEAEALLKKTIMIDSTVLGKEHPSYAISLNNLASYYHSVNAFEKEKPLLLESLHINEKVFGETHPVYASTLYNLAVLYSSTDQYKKADSLFNRVLAIREQKIGKQHPDYALTLYGKAVLYKKEKEYALAAPLFAEVINSYMQQIRLYFPALSEKEKSAFYRRIEPIIKEYRNFAIEYYNYCESHNQPAQKDSVVANLYNLQLATKALLLSASNKIRQRILNSSDDQLRQMFKEWVLLKEYLIKLYGQSQEELQASNIDIPSIEQQANELEKQLSARSSLFAQNTDNTQNTWLDVQHALVEKEMAVEIVRIPVQEKEDSILYAAMIVLPDQPAPELVIFPHGEHLENKVFNYYRNAIMYTIEDTLSYEAFWKPVAEMIPPQTRTIYFAADGIYNKVNLNTLYEPGTGIGILDQYEIRLLSSTRDLIAEKTETIIDYKQAWLFGFPTYTLGVDRNKILKGETADMKVSKTSDQVPFTENIRALPGTLQEVNILSGMLSKEHWVVHKYVKDEASEEVIKGVRNPTVLHFATHGFFMSDLDIEPGNAQKAFGINIQNVRANPLLRSGLLFAGAANTISGKDLYQPTEINDAYQGDGILTAYEVMNMDLDGTELVVLSACETGLGEIKNGEGVYGLQRAFLVAGAQSIIMSLWKVNDHSTQQLMELFYKNWVSDVDKYTAFTQALRTFKNTMKDPKQWGAFVMIGR